MQFVRNNATKKTILKINKEREFQKREEWSHWKCISTEEATEWWIIIVMKISGKTENNRCKYSKKNSKSVAVTGHGGL
jgi:hypothetical protein